MMDRFKKAHKLISVSIVAMFIFLAFISIANAAEKPQCERTITADVVAIDQPFFYNRLGAFNPAGMMFALRQDVIDSETNKSEAQGGKLKAGNVKLRLDKRPRPLVLRMNVGDCLEVNFENLLAPNPVNVEQPSTRTASLHVMGMQLVNSIKDDGSNVGENPSSLVKPDEKIKYTFFAERENTFLLYSTAATTGGEGDGGSLATGLFGALNVEPRGAVWYRSQVTEVDMNLSTTGYTSAGLPIINYNAVYPNGHNFSGVPILKMLNDNNKIVHSDLNAIISGPNNGRFPDGTHPVNAVLPDREQPFREFTVIFHDEIVAQQAFPDTFNAMIDTLHSVRDGFAINYGTGGVGSEIIANRLGVGPMTDCVECKYEEFFLTAWAVGDPAMVVDIPANSKDVNGNITLGKKATKALYPDDPSNVHHSYLSDHVKFRNVHAGPKEHHIFHLHAHQWLFNPDSDTSAYLDSQAIGPGSGYTYEIAHNGSGNRNQALGDSIFHCHFYPHFAQGMWELWRVHDVFENGTKLVIDPKDGLPMPAKGSRALPDGEIMNGTPIPALVPLPGLPMAPMPQAKVEIINGQVNITNLTQNMPIGNPGYPFFIPGIAGHRPPHPPLDTIDDGGLPRHIITSPKFAESHETPLDFNKELINVTAVEVPEEGTVVEKIAMQFHATRFHNTSLPDGTPVNNSLGFKTNGRPPVEGAPFADPCVTDDGLSAIKQDNSNFRNISIAAIQIDMVLNKLGDHFPQARILTLWGDAIATMNGTKPPEPLFMRVNSGDCVSVNHTNLVPHVYEQDDFQVKTPTDIIGQHIHLVKFDVTSSDGSANGWNYEDGTFSPGELIERIKAINNESGMVKGIGQNIGLGALNITEGTKSNLTPKPHPFFGNLTIGLNRGLGAQTTVQRWYADNVLDNNGNDRTLRTVFTHDHYGPSTHQQVGLYAGLLVEPENSTWKNPETGAVMGNRVVNGTKDGGPTSWNVIVETQNKNDSYREFMFEFGDFQLAYKKGGGGTASNPIPDPAKVINPPIKKEVGLPDLFIKGCLDLVNGCPEAISADDPGMFSVNYRNEPVAYRVLDPTNVTDNASTTKPVQVPGIAGDLSYVYRSDIIRKNPLLNVQPDFYPPLTPGVQPGDPFTPLMRAYEGDKIQIRTLVGAHEEGHTFTIHGLKWLHEPSDVNSGYRNTQMMGISEHFEFRTTIPSVPLNGTNFSDYLYKPAASTDAQWNGMWGILRAYNTTQTGFLSDLKALPNNNVTLQTPPNIANFDGVCPTNANVRAYDVTAITAQQALENGMLIYNSREGKNKSHLGPLNDPTAILYVLTKDLDKEKLKDDDRIVEPLVLRANAGDCVKVTLRNKLPDNKDLPDLPGFTSLSMIIEKFNANSVKPSKHVGLHPQLVTYDVTLHDGTNVGLNKKNSTVAPGESITYKWYAGNITQASDGTLIATPIEFGATNLIPSDPIKHSNKGAIGALIIEPIGSSWIEDEDTRASATVKLQDGSYFREFVLLFQDNLNLRDKNNNAIPNLAESEDAEDSGHAAFNYRTEPLWFRMGFAPDAPLAFTRTFDFTKVLTNDQVGDEPQTPIFKAKPGDAVRFRILEPGGQTRNHVFQMHGHIWETEPYINGSTKLGNNPLSQWIGSIEGNGPANHFDILLKNGAGGLFKVKGDYLYRDQVSFQFDGGLWGLFIVAPNVDLPMKNVPDDEVDEDVHVISRKEKVKITIPKGTKIYDKDNLTLKSANITLYPIIYLRKNETKAIQTDEMVVGELVEPMSEGVKFSQAIQMRFNYTKPLPTNMDEANLKVKFFNTTSNTWDDLKVIERNTTENYVVANVTHFTRFALIGKIVAPYTPPPNTGSGGGGGGGVVTGEKYENIEKVEVSGSSIYADKDVEFKFTVKEHGIDKIVIKGSENEPEIVVRVEALKDISNLVTKPPEGTVNKYINIWVGTKRIKGAVINFKVTNSWIKDNGFADSEIKLVRWNDDKWNVLDTKVKSKDDSNTYFEANTEGFSPFAIIGVKAKDVPAAAVQTVKPTEAPAPEPQKPKVTSTQEKPKGTSGFEIALVIAAFCVIYIFRQKRR